MSINCGQGCAKNNLKWCPNTPKTHPYPSHNFYFFDPILYKFPNPPTRRRCNFIFVESRQIPNNMTNPSFQSCPRPPGNIERINFRCKAMTRRQNGITADSQSSKKT